LSVFNILSIREGKSKFREINLSYVFNAQVRSQRFSPERDSGCKLRERWLPVPPAPPVLPRQTFSAACEYARKPNNRRRRAQTSALRRAGRGPKFSLLACLSPNLPTARI